MSVSLVVAMQVGYCLLLLHVFGIFPRASSNAEVLFPYTETLTNGMLLEWDYDEIYITMKLTGPTTGWIGIGFSENGTLQEADVIMTGVQDNVPYIRDAYVSTLGLQTDISQDVAVLDYAQNKTHTTVTIRRKIDTRDLKDYAMKEGYNYVSWGSGLTNGLGKSEPVWQSVGHRYINLLGEKSSTLGAAGSPEATHSLPPIQTFSSNLIREDIQQEETEIDFLYSIPLDFERAVYLRWNFDKDNITLQLIAPTRGWIGIGFSQTVSMAGADMIIMGVEENGEAYAVDVHAEKNGLPIVDESQDAKVVSYWENDTHTAVVVTRKLITCDNNDAKIEEGTYRMIWAYGSNDCLDKVPTLQNYHRSNRGSKSLKLLNPSSIRHKKSENEDNVKFFDIRADNLTVPPLDTYYYCKVFKLPDTSHQKHHVIEFEAQLTPGNEKNVHHILIMLCEDSVDKSLLETHRSCFKEINPYLAGCIQLFVGWAIGMTNYVYPKVAGFPFGDVDSHKYVMLQTHYDNPDLREFVDNSGMRIYYTDVIRQNDVGLISVQRAVSNFWVPPNVDKYRLQGYCSHLCLRKSFAKSRRKEVNVIGVVLHSHLAGRSLRLRHFRRGVEMAPLAKDDHYDFNYQETQFKQEGESKLMLGDSLIMQCDYETLERKTATMGGLGTMEEMCSAFISYYPKIDLDHCDSTVKLFGYKNLLAMERGLNITIKPEEAKMLMKSIANRHGTMKVFSPILNKVKWTPEKIIYSKALMNPLRQNPICTSRYEWLLNFHHGLKVPKHEDYEEADQCIDSAKPVKTVPRK